VKNSNVVIVITGPTASGKTKVGVELAKDLNGDIISCDSMQIYKYMDIGTAKPTHEEMSGIKHYLVDEIFPDEEFSVAKYKALALKYISEVKDSGRVPIVIGGTGLYINSLIYNISFSETVCDWNLRNRLTIEALEKGNEHIFRILESIDPTTASRLHMNDTKRVIRAIEVFKHTGKPISEHQIISRNLPSQYKFLVFCLNMGREKLYTLINKRVDKMFEDGLVNEVERLLQEGYTLDLQSMQAIGYKEVGWYLDKKISLNEAIEAVKIGSRRYAKRQLTWFRKLNDIVWIDVEEFNIYNIIKNMKDCIETSGIFL
jgi:tRNA dimethylallyltransferase